MITLSPQLSPILARPPSSLTEELLAEEPAEELDGRLARAIAAELDDAMPEAPLASKIHASVDALCPVQFWSAKCLTWSIVTRAHIPRQVAKIGAADGRAAVRLQAARRGAATRRALRLRGAAAFPSSGRTPVKRPTAGARQLVAPAPAAPPLAGRFLHRHAAFLGPGQPRASLLLRAPLH